MGAEQADAPDATAPLSLVAVHLERGGRRILADVTWRVAPGERWLVLGANGSGKTSLVRVASLYEHPTAGTVEVLGERLGRTDVRALRRRIGLVSPALAAQLRPTLLAREIVVTAHHAALEPWWHHYDDELWARADRCLDDLGVGHLAHRSLGTVSSGEFQRVLLARGLMNDPGLVLLDEPSARLDLGGREQLVQALDELADRLGPVPMVLVSHHLEETPSAVTHVLALRAGRVLAAGPLDDVLDDALLSECYGLPLRLERHDDGRLSARTVRATR
jgi:iron complex transport system ATP-binding protein